jgi:hypothetical protein
MEARLGQKDTEQLSIDAVERTRMNLAVEKSQRKPAGAARLLVPPTVADSRIDEAPTIREQSFGAVALA